MDDISAFEDRSARFGLPFLFPGQVQREFYVNESLARIDMLLHPAIEGEVSTPPSAPLAGQIYLVSSGSDPAWSDKEGHLACWDGQQWSFVAPRLGMQVFDLSQSHYRRFDGSWLAQTAPAEPEGGSVVDTEARGAIMQLIEALKRAGIY